ncbi:PDZ domain-containing protein [Flavobacterium sp. '19STA2R22 D10 B1']|uniref:PDZ domain-containing protein n=1 Tax=Flavobacterium aerium TaxID=3037261 RepID=UPI00278BE9C5|nr:PDZ domain-containing protein [Flavobacterium sp. '19STA2R22 D10 B1']
MKYCFCFLLICGILENATFAQPAFEWETTKSKVVIPFQSLNNLIIIPVVINGVKLQFILDTGVDKTVVFSLNENETVNFHNLQKIRLTGLGGGEPIEALKSGNNRMIIDGLVDYNHMLYIIPDGSIGFSSHLGIAINGIIGHSFFKNAIVEIDYARKKVIVYKSLDKIKKKILRKYSTIPISIEEQKPYVKLDIELNSNKIPVKLLIDTGSSDAIWLFTEDDKNITVPQEYFEDFLGIGFSGDIRGKRARMQKLFFGEEILNNPTVAFPDSISIKNVSRVEARNGSLGGEVLKRFSVVFDYNEHTLYYRKNRNFDAPFSYNMSGIELQHAGVEWIKEETLKVTRAEDRNKSDVVFDVALEEFKYKFALKPVYVISSVRKGSPGDLSGLVEGDRLVKINGKRAYKYSLQDINALLHSEEGKSIYVEIERNGVMMKFQFYLKNIL